MEEDTYLNYDLIKYNQLLIEANRFFQTKDIQNAIKNYEEALETNEALQSLEKTALIKTNLGIIFFHNCEYKKSLLYLQDSFELINRYKSEQQQALLVKLLGNLCVVNLVNNNYERSKECNEQALDIIQKIRGDQEKQRLLFEELMFIYFRFSSFESMGDGFFENVEQRCIYIKQKKIFKDDGASLGCFYSAMGINRELCGDFPLAYNYHKKSLEVWQQCKQNGFIVITIRRLISLGQQLKVSDSEMKEYVRLLQKYLQTEELRGISQEALFKDCEKKIQCARDITFALKLFEDSQQFLKQVQIKTQNENEEPLWKMALRLRLKRAINVSRSMLQNSESSQPLIQTIQQLQFTVQSISQPQPKIVENQMMNQQFTKESVNHLKAQINRIRKVALKSLCGELFYIYQDMKNVEAIKQKEREMQMTQLMMAQQSQIQQSQQSKSPQPQQPQKSNIQSSIQQSSIIQQSKVPAKSYINVTKYATQTALLGDYLIKCNKTSNGRIQRFFKMALDNTFRWADKDKNINDPNKIYYYKVSDLRGIVYGKCTDVLCKPYNKQLENWLCFSLITQERTMDFYVEPDQINPWFIAFATEIKRRNPQLRPLTPGRFLWRKLKFILHWFFVVGSPQRKKDKNFNLRPAKTIILFRNNGLRLPQLHL